MTAVRPPAAAGLFYPGRPDPLRAAVREYLGPAVATEAALLPPKALIVPHAGYVYSGPVAGSAYRRLTPLRGVVTRVVLLGPAHFVPLRGLAVPSAAGLATPLGVVAVDRAGVDAILSLPQVHVSDEAHAREHCLEVQLPFLLEVLGNVSVVPLVVGEAAPALVGEVLERLWGGPETLIVVSSDLSHYHDANTARRLDEATARAIEALDIAAIDTECACGCYAVCGFLWAARRQGLRGWAVDVRSSGDTAGPKDTVVGYGAFVFAAAPPSG